MSGFWNPKPTYPPDAVYSVTLKATDGQRHRWECTAERLGIKSRGAFIAWAADFACFALEAQDRAHEERHQEMHLWDRKGE